MDKKKYLNKHRKITLDEHKEIARELTVIYEALHKLTSELHDRGYRQFSVNSYFEVLELRSYLDDVFAAEHPDDYSYEIYYPRKRQ